MADFLIGQCDIMESGDTEDKRRKLIYDRIPEKVKDAPALARELKWRVERELPECERNHEHMREIEYARTVKKESGKENTRPKKRSTPIVPSKSKSRVWNFSPP